MQDARAHDESTNTCSCLNQTVALASLIPSTHSVTFPNIASLGRSLDETWAGIEKCTSCGNRRQIAESMSQSVLKLTMFCEAACVTYKLLNNSNQLQPQPFSSGAGSQQQQQLPVIDGHAYSSYQQQQQQPFYAFATPTPTLTPTDDPAIQGLAVVCEKRPMRLQSYLLDDEEAELLALQIVGAIAEKLSSITFTLQAWEFEFENERDAFGRGSAGPVSRVSVEGIQARVGVLRRNLRSEGNRQSHTSDSVGIL